MKHTNPVPRFGSITLAIWVLFAACMAGCATSFAPGPVSSDLRDMRQSSSRSPVHEPPDPITPPPETLPVTSELVPTRVIPDGAPAPAGLIEPTWRSMAAGSGVVPCSAQLTSGRCTDGKPTCDRWVIPTLEERFGTDMPLRPPLRQLWFRHPRLVPLGDDAEFGLPDSEILAHRDRVTSHPFRNPYAGFRDQPLFHRDSSRAPATDSRLPELGPPPPRHSVKTFATLTGASLLGLAFYAAAPASVTGINKETAVKEGWQDFKNAWTKPPVVDKDGADVNYLGHPYVGMNYYLAARNYGESPLYSFLFATFTSTAFEYLVESWAEQPSIQDLLITPIVGSILGEIVYRATQAMRKDGFTKAEKIILTIINPLYVLQNGYQ